MWSIKWNPTEKFDCCHDNPLTFLSTTLIPVVPYVLWQFTYFVKVQLVDKYKFLIDPDYMTSFKYLVEQKHSSVYRIVNIFGKRHRIVMYGILQLVYTVICILPTKWFYESFWLHTLYITAMGITCCWNGANFYIEVFSIQYQKNLMECEKQWNELSRALNLNPAGAQETPTR